MKCPHCGSLNNDDSKFCKNCGSSINKGSLAFQDKFGKNRESDDKKPSKINQNVLIICITLIICVVIVAGALMYVNSNNDDEGVIFNNTTTDVEDNLTKNNSVIDEISGSWNLVGNFSGHGTGLKYYTLPQGKIKVDISAYPKDDEEVNWLIVSSSGGDSVSVDWDSQSVVEYKYESLIFNSTGKDKLCVDYMELVNWNVEIYQYS